MNIIRKSKIFSVNLQKIKKNMKFNILIIKFKINLKFYEIFLANNLTIIYIIFYFFKILHLY